MKKEERGYFREEKSILSQGEEYFGFRERRREPFKAKMMKKKPKLKV